MSNRTPAAVRAKDRERRQREKRAKQVKAEQKACLWSRAKLIWTGVIFLIFTGVPALLSYFPSLSVLPASTVRSHDPMGTVFNLTNNGLLAVHDVDQSCGIDRLQLEGEDKTRVSASDRLAIRSVILNGARLKASTANI
jgi:hypothetical protein